MHRARPADTAALQRAIADALHRDESTRYLCRLLSVGLVGAGNSCGAVARWLGLNVRSIERWVRAYNRNGTAALQHAPSAGRPPRLTLAQKQLLLRELGQEPQAQGYAQSQWTGKLLARHLERRYGVALGARQCQRILERSCPRMRQPLGRSWRARPLSRSLAGVYTAHRVNFPDRADA